MDYCLSMLRLKTQEDLSSSQILQGDEKGVVLYSLECSAEKLLQVELYKAEGNTASKEDKHTKAIKAYTKGISLFKVEKNVLEHENHQNSTPLQLLCILLSNRAASFIKV